MMLVDKSVVIQSHKSQRQFNECMVLQGKNLRKTCQILPEMLTDIGIIGIYLLHDCYNIKPVRKEEGKSYWKIPLCDDDATREK